MNEKEKWNYYIHTTEMKQGRNLSLVFQGYNLYKIINLKKFLPIMSSSNGERLFSELNSNTFYFALQLI